MTDAGSQTHVQLDATVSGRVQGVGFRMFVRDLALRLGLRGWVANEPDGSVRCVAEGPRDALMTLRAALADGPGGSRIDAVSEAWGPASGSFEGFAIRSGWHAGD